MALASLSPLLHKPFSNPFPLLLLSFPIPSTRSHPITPSSTNHNHLFSSSSSSSSPLHPHRPFLSSFPPTPHSPRPLTRCHASSPGPPPESDPPPPNHPVRLTGLAASLSKFQDRVQIFFAVFIWMSLFFWASAWDERSRPNKGSRFRR